MSDKILVVDDDIDSLKLIGLMLQRQGYEVIAANAGYQALAKAQNERPDLIILDVMMPDMNGYEVCRRLRANPETNPIPIIMFSAKNLIDDKVAGFEAGADDYLTKPTHPDELAARVRQMLARAPKALPIEASRGETIGIIGAKGGIGTTTLAVNLAAALLTMPATETARPPIVADVRLGVGSLALMLGVRNPSGMANLLTRAASELQPNAIQRELVTHQTGLRALLSAYQPSEAQLNVSQDSALALVEGLRSLSPSIVFDLGSRYDALTSRLIGVMDRVIVVVEPQNITLTMAQALIHEIEAQRRKSPEIVVVTHSSAKSQIPWHEVEQHLEHDILAIISAAPEPLFHASEAGSPVVLHQPNTIIASQIIKLAADIKS